MTNKKIFGADAAVVATARSASDSDQLTHAALTHTPGPWEVHEVIDDYVISRGVRSSVTGKGINTGEDYEMFSEADAHLIAAAPELLEVLRGILSLNGVRIDRDLCKAAQAAIAKAEGRS